MRVALPTSCANMSRTGDFSRPVGFICWNYLKREKKGRRSEKKKEKNGFWVGQPPDFLKNVILIFWARKIAKWAEIWNTASPIVQLPVCKKSRLGLRENFGFFFFFSNFKAIRVSVIEPHVHDQFFWLRSLKIADAITHRSVLIPSLNLSAF